MIESVGRTSTFLLVVAVIGLAAAARWRQGGVALAASANAFPTSDQTALTTRKTRAAPANSVAEDELGAVLAAPTRATWAPSPRSQWELAHVQASTRVEPQLGARSLARSIPPHADSASAADLEAGDEGEPRDANFAMRHPYGDVAWLDTRTLRVVDGMPSRSSWTQVELRLRLRDDGGFDAELAAFSIRDASSTLEPWTTHEAEVVLDRPLRARVTTEDARGATRETLVARYSLRGRDSRGRERTLAGLVELTPP